MSDTMLYPVPAAWGAGALINAAAHERLYAEAATDPDGFWRREAGRVDRMTPFSRVKETIAENDFGSLGDTSTLADPAIVDALIDTRARAA